jgi:hypothetical protein
VCEAAVHVAAAAQRLGLAVVLDDGATRYDVPVLLPDGGVARLPCDLLAVAIWATGP